MRYFSSAVHSVLICSIPALSFGQETFQSQEISLETGKLSSYDEILNLVEDIESGACEEKYGEADLEGIRYFLADLAEKGVFANEGEEASELAYDIHELLYNEGQFQYAYCLNQSNESSLLPAIYYGSEGYLIYRASWFNKQCRQIKDFVHKHKKEIIIGAAIFVAVAVAVCAVVACSAMAANAAAAVAAGAAASADQDKGPNAIADTPALDSAMQKKESEFKSTVVREGLLNSELPFEENMRILGRAWAYQSSEDIQNSASLESDLYRELVDMGAPSDFKLQKPNSGIIDAGFSQGDFSCFTCGNNFTENVYQLRGERALDLRYYNQAVSDMDKAIGINPNNPDYYLNRSTAYLQKGDYDRSMNDYEQYVAKKPSTLEYVGDFSIGFAGGLYDGAKDSTAQMGSFVFNAAVHPIDTASEVCQSFSTLSKLVKSGDWDTISQALAPEVRELVKNWDNLSPREQGELSGKAVGKYGADILVPGSAVKLASGTVRGLKEVAVACKSLKNAERVLALEIASESAEGLGVFTASSEKMNNAIVDLDKFAEGGKAFDKADFTKAGRGSVKHGGRENSVFPKQTGTPAQINENGQKILESILYHPEKEIIFGEFKRYGKVVDIFAPGKGGVRYSVDGKFIGFLEPRK